MGGSQTPRISTLSVMRDDHCDVHPIRVDHGLNGWRKFALWRGQEVVVGLENRKLCTENDNVKDD